MGTAADTDNKQLMLLPHLRFGILLIYRRCWHTFTLRHTVPVSQKVDHFITSENSGPIFHIFFAVKVIKDLWRKLELKLPPPIKSVTIAKSKRSSIQYSCIHSY